MHAFKLLWRGLWRGLALAVTTSQVDSDRVWLCIQVAQMYAPHQLFSTGRGFALQLQRAVPLVQWYPCISVCYSFASYIVNIPSVRHWQARNSGAAGGINGQPTPSGGLGLLQVLGAAASPAAPASSSSAQAAARPPLPGAPAKTVPRAKVATKKKGRKRARGRQDDDDGWLDGEAEDAAEQLEAPFDHKLVEVGQFLGFKADQEPGFYLGKVMQKPEKGADGAMVVQVQWWASDPKRSTTSPARRKFYVALDKDGNEFHLEKIPCATCLTQAFDLTRASL